MRFYREGIKLRKYLLPLLLGLLLLTSASMALGAEDAELGQNGMDGYPLETAQGAVKEQPYQNGMDGYWIVVPGDWIIDDSHKGTMTRLTAPDEKAVIKIFAQPLQGISAADYIEYGNRNIIQQKDGVKLLAQNRSPVNGIRAYRLMWERPRLSNIENDLNIYREIDLIFSGQVYTLVLKTNYENYERYNSVFDSILGSFQRVPIVPEYPLVEYQAINDIELKGKTMQIDIPKDKMMWGIFHPLFHPYVFYPQAIKDYKDYEDSLGHKFEFIMTYTEFYKAFPAQLVADTYADGRIMMMTWAPFKEQGQNDVLIPSIANGDWDPYISEWARQVKNVGEPMFVRFGNEMNGDWIPWCDWFFSKDADLYVQAWQRIHKIFKEQGVDNAIFVWNPHDRSFPDFKWNSAELYYPGEEYVDWVGLTGYNNGTGYYGETWRNFNEIYQSIYNEYLLKYPGKPFMITEFSSSELGGDKADWINQTMTTLRWYPNIRMAVWYDQTDGKRLYRIDSTPASKEAFRQGLANPYYLQDGIKIQPADGVKK